VDPTEPADGPDPATCNAPTCNVSDTIVVGWKWVSLDDDVRWAGVSDADRAALELALRLRERDGGEVVVVSAGPAGAEHALREALAVGADRAIRIAVEPDLRSDAVAAALAEVARGARWVLCGDHSADRGSGSVPAFLAAELGAVQALGLVELHPTPGATTLQAVRRLDGGRREELEVASPAVLSVEGAVAALRRASLPGEVAARRAEIATSSGPDGPAERPAAVRPYRPRARVLPAPAGDGALDRVRALLDTGESGHGELVTLDPPEAARRILVALRAWGYLPDDPLAGAPTAE
jgi:electron transfer flavoprotein beta subunit